MVGFFIVGRVYNQSDSGAFFEALSQQLVSLVRFGKEEEQLTLYNEMSILELLSEAAENANDNGKKLVLVVDALDEDKSLIRERQSILNLLPKQENPNLTIILSSRPEPNVQDSVYLGYSHPIKHCPVYKLKQLKLSKDFKERAKDELRTLYDKSNKSKDIVSFIAVADGALTVSDLSELTGEIPIEISRIFEDSTARTFLSIKPTHISSADYSDKGYMLGHDDLQKQAMRDFVGKESPQYIKKLDVWCDGYKERGWSSDIPNYLLTSYLGLLTNHAKWERLADMLIDYSYIGTVSRNTLSCAYYLSFINNAIEALAKQKAIDYVRIGLLTESREWLSLRDENIPQELPVLFTKLGYIDEAEAMTKTMSDKDRLSCLSKIAVELARQGNKKRAVEIALDIISEIPLNSFHLQRSNMHEHDYTYYLTNCTTALILCGESKKAEDFFIRLIWSW